jgi:hypothetical protein
LATLARLASILAFISASRNLLHCLFLLHFCTDATVSAVFSCHEFMAV